MTTTPRVSEYDAAGLHREVAEFAAHSSEGARLLTFAVVATVEHANGVREVLATSTQGEASEVQIILEAGVELMSRPLALTG